MFFQLQLTSPGTDDDSPMRTRNAPRLLNETLSSWALPIGKVLRFNSNYPKSFNAVHEDQHKSTILILFKLIFRTIHINNLIQVSSELIEYFFSCCSL